MDFRDRVVKMTGKNAKLTYLLILICVIVFFLEVSTASQNENALNEIFSKYGFSLENVENGNYWVFATSLFLHGGANHLVLNLIALFFFGRIVEMELGWKKFSEIFIASSIVGELGILTLSFSGILSSSIPTIGISAAVFGLMGTAMLIKPFEFILYPYLIPIPLILVAVIYTLYNIAAFVLELTTGLSTSISYVSHIGGMAAGMFFGFKEEKSNKGLVILLVLLLLLILIPLLWIFYGAIESLNYINIIANLFK